MRARSYQSIAATVKNLCRWAKTEKIEELCFGTVQAYLYWGKEERCWAARTFRNQRIYLRSFFTWCVNQGFIQKNPTDGITSLPGSPRESPEHSAERTS